MWGGHSSHKSFYIVIANNYYDAFELINRLIFIKAHAEYYSLNFASNQSSSLNELCCNLKTNDDSQYNGCWNSLNTETFPKFIMFMSRLFFRCSFYTFTRRDRNCEWNVKHQIIVKYETDLAHWLNNALL